VSKYTSSR